MKQHMLRSTHARVSTALLSYTGLLAAAFAVGCSSTESPCLAPSSGATSTSPADPGTDVLSPLRLLRRASLSLRGTAPTDAEMAELLAAGDATAQSAYVESYVDKLLQHPKFYRTMFELGRDWLNVPMIANSADEPEYGPQQQRSLQRCPSGTPKAGAWHYGRDFANIYMVEAPEDACSGVTATGAPVATRTLEPWWAPGTMVTLVGQAANTSTTGKYAANGAHVTIQCNGRPEGDCGCGPGAVRCHADYGTYRGWQDYAYWNETGQRRQLSEEPARLFAHLAWYDRPATDLITASYSVGTTNVQAAYVMQGIEGGAVSLVNDDSWWQPAKYMSAAVDPEHTAGDANAWREFQVADRNPFLIADRSYHYDPRTETTPMRGIPAAGMLTTPGFLNGLPRERLRAARAMENLACEIFAPPSGVTFNPYVRDPYNEGPCQHCHKRIDPAAIHFKRWGRTGAAQEGYGAHFLMPDIGTAGVWKWPKAWRTGAYPFDREPWSQWNRWYVADTGLTPVPQALIDQRPEAAFIDFLDPDKSLMGQRSDGTVGPLGFAKLIVAAGAFDRCVVRKLHTRVMGRDIDPTKEVGYLDTLTASFVGGGRKVRPFVKALTKSELFRRGI